MADKKGVVIESGISISKYGEKGGRARWESSPKHELKKCLEPKYKAWSKKMRSLERSARIAKAQYVFSEARKVTDRVLWKWMLEWDGELACKPPSKSLED
jgi:hypothetical protein